MEGYQNFQEKLDIKILILFILRRLPGCRDAGNAHGISPFPRATRGILNTPSVSRSWSIPIRWSRKETFTRFPSAARETARSWRAVCR